MLKAVTVVGYVSRLLSILGGELHLADAAFAEQRAVINLPFGSRQTQDSAAP